jgi:hypothetical protein
LKERRPLPAKVHTVPGAGMPPAQISSSAQPPASAANVATLASAPRDTAGPYLMRDSSGARSLTTCTSWILSRRAAPA